MRPLLWSALLALLVSGPGQATAGTSVGVNVGVSNGPSTIQLSFRTEPDQVYVPEQRVYVVEDESCGDDVFRYGSTWWLVREDHWYRARSWRGPFVVAEERFVPRAIWLVPARRWKHHSHGMPPGRSKQHDVVVASRRPTVVVVKEKHHKHGHGEE